ncbi:uncharacterized protein P884DRAFT_278111 [Thermothelomyces heterothallicus CBS 202.75]|uniref:uncharacterized protein n=1 Tax=Thermothelomyces heterothallicus CBS 202.75 TaxID=1149848 RepID=UPI003744272A
MAPFFKKHKDTDKAGKKGGTGKAKVKPEGKAKTTGGGAADALALAGSPSAEPALFLNDEDEEFLERLVSNDNEDDEDGRPPPLPPRPKTPDLVWDDSESFRVSRAGEGSTTTPPTATAAGATTTTTKKPNRLSRIFHRKHSTSTTLTVPSSTAAEVTPEEADREWADLNRVLSPLGIEPADPDSPNAPNKGAKNSSSSTTATTTKASKTSRTKAAALTASAEIQSLLRQFVVVLKDIMRGAPTAVDDLTALLDGRNDVLKRGFEKLPSSMQKLVTQLPKKLTSSLGPEVLAAAAEARGLKKDTDAGGLARFLMPKTLNDLVLTPAIVKNMLKAIVNALKARWPAFVGTNVLWSAAVFLLLFVLWYFHKRGKEEREKREKEAAEREAGEGKVDEKEVSAEDGLRQAEEDVSSAVVVVEPPVESSR